MNNANKIIEGLQEAVRGDFPRVTIDGVTYVRQDAGSPEDMLASARSKVAELTQRIDVLEMNLADTVGLLEAARSGLRSYQYANASPELAKSMVDAIDDFIRRTMPK